MKLCQENKIKKGSGKSKIQELTARLKE